MAALIDIEDPRIERDIGDPHNRVPHFVVDEEEWTAGDQHGVLYWPCCGAWKALAFHTPEEAIAFLDEWF